MVDGSESRLGKATVGSWCTEKRWKFYKVKKATLKGSVEVYILGLEKSRRQREHCFMLSKRNSNRPDGLCSF